MSNNNYGGWWKENKASLSLFPALFFWVVSVIFFIVGLKFENPIFLFGKDLSMVIAIGLSISNTFIQILGNDQEGDEMGLAMWLGWVGSYMLGIGTNVAGLYSVFAIQPTWLRWTISIGLGTMIEVLPERLFVKFLQSIKVKSKNNNQQQNSNNNHRQQQQQNNNQQRQQQPGNSGGNSGQQQRREISPAMQHIPRSPNAERKALEERQKNGYHGAPKSGHPREDIEFAGSGGMPFDLERLLGNPEG